MVDKLETEWREVLNGQVYLERVEAAGMQILTQSILDKDWGSADEVIRIMERLSIV